MFNKLCTACIHDCKQPATVRIVTCPEFRKRPSEREFRAMIDEMDRMEKNARSLQRGIRKVIRETVASPEPSDSESDSAS